MNSGRSTSWIHLHLHAWNFATDIFICKMFSRDSHSMAPCPTDTDSALIWFSFWLKIIILHSFLDEIYPDKYYPAFERPIYREPRDMVPCVPQKGFDFQRLKNATDQSPTSEGPTDFQVWIPPSLWHLDCIRFNFSPRLWSVSQARMLGTSQLCRVRQDENFTFDWNKVILSPFIILSLNYMLAPHVQMT